MVAYHIIRDLQNLAVHGIRPSFSAFDRLVKSKCINSIVAFDRVPAVLTYSLIVLGIDDSVFSLGQADSSERVAVADTPIQKHEKYDRPFEPIRDLDN